MKNDFLRELEFLGITARLKRLSDAISYSIKDLYKSQDLDIEPSWHLVFLILKNEKEVSLTEIADALNFSQPAMTKMITRMKNKGYVEISISGKDTRKKLIFLSKKAKKELPKFEKIWDAGQKSIRQILKDNMDFFSNLEEFENQILLKSFKDRALENLKND